MTLQSISPAVAPGSIFVSTAAELKAALAAAKGGETIVLKPGDYGSLSLQGGKDIPVAYTSKVAIVSQNPADMAVIKGLDLNGGANITFKNIKFDYVSEPGDSISATPFMVDHSNGIRFLGCRFDGDTATGVSAVDDGYGAGKGLVVRSSSGVLLANSEFHNWYRAATFGQSDHVQVAGNNISDCSSDGLNFADVDNVVIKANWIHDFRRSAASTAHPDMIQFWTNGTTSPSVNIRIVKNILDIGGGDLTHGIFMRNELVDGGMSGLSMYYRNVEIANNVIRNSQFHGITVGETIGLNIHHNTMVQSISWVDGGSGSVPFLNVASASQLVKIADNLVPAMAGNLLVAHAGWTVINNHIVQIDNPHAGNYLGHLFSNALDPGKLSFADMLAVPGGVVEKWGAGAGAALPPGLTGTVVSHETSSGGYIVQNFDCSNVFSKSGAVDTTGATATWSFGDGTKGSGLTVGHVYTEAGEYTARARIVLATGKILNVEKTVTVHSADYLNLDFTSGFADRSAFANLATLHGATIETLIDGNKALRFNGGTVEYHANSDFVFNDAFTLLTDFKKDPGHELEGGSLVYKSDSLIAKLGGDSVKVLINTSKGWVTLSASGVGIADTDWHRLAVTFSGEAGVAKLFLDGVGIDQKTGLQGAVEIGGLHCDLFLGGPFGDSFGGLVDNVHFLGEALSGGNIRAADPLASWKNSGAHLSVVVADHLAGGTSTDLTSFMSPTQIDLLFANWYSGLLSNTDFQVI